MKSMALFALSLAWVTSVASAQAPAKPLYVLEDSYLRWRLLPAEQAYLTVLRRAFDRAGEGASLQLYFGATSGDVFMGGLGGVLMVLSLAGSLYPVPPAPYNLFPYFFLVYMLVGVSWFYILKVRVPQALLGIEHDLEVAGAGAAE